jgi:probable HAF family extracellular repeat protein
VKSLIVRIVFLAVVLLASITYGGNVPQDPAKYFLIILSSLNGTQSSGISINNVGVVGGWSDFPDTSRRAILWQNQVLNNLGTLPGGPNSTIAWPVKNNKGLVAGLSETDLIDPYLENWSCSAFFNDITHHQCLGFKWKNGVMTPLPTLGGGNGYAAGVNNRDQIVGWAENQTLDSSCSLPQRLQFRAVIWGPKDGQIQQLLPYATDPTSAATAINDDGQVVGISGLCNNSVGRLSAIHALTWQNVNDPILLDDLGVGAWNTPTSINQKGNIVGFLNQPGATVTGLRPRGALWTKNAVSNPKTYDLHPLPFLTGDIRSFAWSINSSGDVVGQSYGGANGSHAVIWHNGVAIDLNDLTPPGSLLLVYANDINDSGQITGQAFDSDTGELLAFLAIPPDDGLDAAIAAAQQSGRESSKGVVPQSAMKQVLQRIGAEENDLQ